jgi:diheme cytochrome c
MLKRGQSAQVVLVLLCAMLRAGAAHAIDDRFNPSRYEKGGFAPVDDALYAKECGSCHFTYLPGMLPARSWHALIGRSGEHFGEALALAPDTARHIEQYLVSKAADAADFRGSEVILYRLEENDVPLRITELPLMRQRHQVVRKLLALPNTSVRSLTNCDSCHERAAAGSFGYGEIVVPGVTKVIKPGGMF